MGWHNHIYTCDHVVHEGKMSHLINIEETQFWSTDCDCGYCRHLLWESLFSEYLLHTMPNGRDDHPVYGFVGKYSECVLNFTKFAVSPTNPFARLPGFQDAVKTFTKELKSIQEHILLYPLGFLFESWKQDAKTRVQESIHFFNAIRAGARPNPALTEKFLEGSSVYELDSENYLKLAGDMLFESNQEMTKDSIHFLVGHYS
ncbi:hypothetical protein KAR91_62755 [Candidatus Pacearchaeota archaeon]|nr:hypothetical protein [Candidatus Pacearchaeota archaeon]